MCEYNSPCMGCEYYNKPYWSVVSPCKSCPRVFGTSDYYITTTMTKKYDNNIVYLPTAKEYDEEAAQKLAFELISRWSEPKYRCPKAVVECARI